MNVRNIWLQRFFFTPSFPPQIFKWKFRDHFPSIVLVVAFIMKKNWDENLYALLHVDVGRNLECSSLVRDNNRAGRGKFFGMGSQHLLQKISIPGTQIPWSGSHLEGVVLYKITVGQSASQPTHAATPLWLNQPIRDFPAGPAAESLCSQFRGPRFDPWSGNWSPHTATKRSCSLQLRLGTDK